MQEKLTGFCVAAVLPSLAVLQLAIYGIFLVFAGSGQFASKVAAREAESVRLRSVEITFVVLESLPKIAHSIVAERLILCVMSALRNALQSAVLNLPAAWTTTTAVVAIVQCLILVRYSTFYSVL